MGWKDSNLQPIPPKDTALPIELHPNEEETKGFLVETETYPRGNLPSNHGQLLLKLLPLRRKRFNILLRCKSKYPRHAAYLKGFLGKLVNVVRFVVGQDGFLDRHA